MGIYAKIILSTINCSTLATSIKTEIIDEDGINKGEYMKINITRGRAKVFTILLRDEQEKAIDLTDWSIIRLAIGKATSCIKKYAPKSAGVNEKQTLSFSAVPDAGSFKLTFGEETTDEIAFDALAADIQTALNALIELSGVVVTGNFAAGFEIEFAGDDGLRAQDLLEVTDGALTVGGASVDITIVESIAGIGPNGIEVVEAKSGEIKVYLSPEDTLQLAEANDQDGDLYVRINAEDLDIDLMSMKFDVTTLDCN